MPMVAINFFCILVFPYAKAGGVVLMEEFIEGFNGMGKYLQHLAMV